MDIEEDIKTIRSKLTGNKKKDIDMLFSAVDKYSKRPYSKEIYLQITELLSEITKDCDPKSMALVSRYILRQSTAKYEKNLYKIRELITKKQLEEALKLADILDTEVTNSIDETSNGCKEPIVFRHYFSAMEERLSSKYFFTENPVNLPFDYLSLLSLKGQALYYSRRPEEALDTVRKAFEFDPVSVDIAFLLADIDCGMGNWISYKMDIEKAVRFLFKEEDYNRYFFYMEQYYEKYLGDKKTGDTLEKFAMDHRKPHLKIKSLDPQTRDFFISQGIHLDLSPEVIETAFNEAKRCFFEKDKRGYEYFSDILLNFREPSEVDFYLNDGAVLKQKSKEKK